MKKKHRAVIGLVVMLASLWGGFWVDSLNLPIWTEAPVILTAIAFVGVGIAIVISGLE